MSAITGLKARMYLTLTLVFAIGFIIISAILYLLGVSSLGIFAFVLLFFLLQWYASPLIVRVASRLHYIKSNEYPELHSMVNELAKQAGVPTPKIAISPSKEPNAFVFGRTRKSATLVVHEGLLNSLNKNELKTVLAHEIGHIKHNDFMVMTVVSFVPMLAYLLAQLFFFGGLGGNRRNGSAYALLIGATAYGIYLLTELLMLSLSRARETFADAYSAEATQKPEDLASALSKITYNLASSKQQTQQSTVTRSFFIADNLFARKDLIEIEKHASEIKKLLPEINIEALKDAVKRERSSAFGQIGAFFSTHPPTYKRIIMLAKLKNK